MFELTVTPAILAYILAGVTAILFDWFPGLAEWFALLTETRKKQIMGVVLAAITGLIYGAVCLGLITSQLACDKPGFAALVQIFLLSVGINQGVHALTKPAKDHPLNWVVR